MLESAEIFGDITAALLSKKRIADFETCVQLDVGDHRPLTMFDNLSGQSDNPRTTCRNDTAEWLARRNPAECIVPGDAVEVLAGKISLEHTGKGTGMVVTTAPHTLANYPVRCDNGKWDPSPPEDGNGVVMQGQAPVKVFGPVSLNDFLVFSGRHDGTTKAVAAEQLDEQLSVVGVVWKILEAQVSDDLDGIRFVKAYLNPSHQPKTLSVRSTGRIINESSPPEGRCQKIGGTI